MPSFKVFLSLLNIPFNIFFGAVFTYLRHLKNIFKILKSFWVSFILEFPLIGGRKVCVEYNSYFENYILIPLISDIHPITEVLSKIIQQLRQHILITFHTTCGIHDYSNFYFVIFLSQRQYRSVQSYISIDLILQYLLLLLLFRLS